MPQDYLRARDLMTSEVVTVRPDMPLASLARLLSNRGISSAPVTGADGRLLGIVTEADLLRRLAGAEDAPVGWLQRLFGNSSRQAADYARTYGGKAEDVMTQDLVTVAPTASVEHCAHLMEERGIKRLPVVRDGRLVGIISRADLLAAVLEPPRRIGTEAETSDMRIRTALWAEMRRQPWIDSIYTFADVNNGVVTLHGFVRSDVVRRGLRVLAARVEGVKRVDDRMDDAPLIMAGEFV